MVNMKKLVFACLLCWALFFTYGVKAHDTGEVVKDETAIYSAPYLNDSIQMSVLYNGNKVKVDQKTNLWLEITTFDGRKGWIRAKDIRNLD